MAAKTGTRRKAPAMRAMVCAAGMVFALAAPAAADELSDVRNELDTKATELATLTDDIEVSQERLATVDGRIDSILSDISSRQADRAALQERISALAKVMYKEGSGVNLAQIVTSSESMGEVLDRMEMRSKVLTEYGNLSAEQRRAQTELEVAYREISNQKDEQYARFAELQQQKSQLDAVVNDLKVRESELDEAQRKALEEAAEAAAQAEQAVQEAKENAVTVPIGAQAAADGAPQDAGAAGSDVNADEVAQQGAEAERQAAEEAAAREAAEAAERQAAEEAAAQQAAEQVAAQQAAQQAAEEAAAQEAASSSAGWMTGLASAYGGSSDPSTPNPGSTATGAVCDDWSMGVAVPIAWGPGAYYGRSVEISYNGMVVVATVNDCGGMGGGSRALDLQPGVFKALGASTCTDWGVREVQYRFL